MKSFSRLAGLAGAVFTIAMLAALAPNASATTTFISNLPVNDGLGLGLTNNQAYAVGFTMSAAYDFDSAIIRLKTFATVPTAALVSVSLFADNGSHQPGSLLEALTGPGSFPTSTTADYTYLPSSPIILQAGQTYWIVLHYTDNPQIQWSANSPPVVPTGPGATYDRTLFASLYGNSWSHQTIGGNDVGPAFSVQGTSTTPEPGTLTAMALGLAGLLAVKRIRRTRMRATRR